MKFLAVFTALFAVALGSQGRWTLQQVLDGMENPATDPALLPYLEQALNKMMLALISGQQVEAVSIATPVGLSPVIVPSPMPVIPSPVQAPAVAASSSPLVQILLNINQKQEATPVAPMTPGAAAEIAPTPVQVVDQAIDNAEVPVSPVVSAPSPVQVVDNSPVSPVAIANHLRRDVISIVTPVGVVPSEEEVVLVPKAQKRFFKKYIKA